MLFRLLYRLFGWRLSGQISPEINKAVLAVCPHTKWQDFFVGLGSRATLKRKIGYLGKEELFKPPFGFIFRCLGGTPVVRSGGHNLVESYALAIQSADNMLFALAPEGTRANVSKLRTGFYYMALAAEIPIIPVGFDFLKKEVVIGEPFFATGDFRKDMQEKFVPFFRTISNTNKDWVNNYEQGKFD